MATGSLRVNQDIIIASKRHHLSEVQKKRPNEAVQALAEMTQTPHGVLNVISDDDSTIMIGQVTRTEQYDPVTSGLRFASGGMNIVSLFTDHSMYTHDYDDLLMLSRGLKYMPIIFQNYVFNEYGVMMARASGAAAIMLYSSILKPETLRLLVSLTQRWRMSVLIQVNSKEELDFAISLNPHAICYGNPITGSVQKDFLDLRKLRHTVPHYIKILFSHSLTLMEDVNKVADLDVDGVFLSENLLSNSKTADKVKQILIG